MLVLLPILLIGLLVCLLVLLILCLELLEMLNMKIEFTIKVSDVEPIQTHSETFVILNEVNKTNLCIL